MRHAKKTLALLTILLIGFAIIMILSQKANRPSSNKIQYPIPRHIQYSFTIQNKTNRLIKNAQFWACAPVRQTSTQQFVQVETSYPCEIISDDVGNQALHFTFQNFPPYGTKIITIKAALRLSENPNSFPDDDLEQYLKAEKYCESNHPDITHIAKKLKRPNTHETIKDIIQWVTSHLNYAGYIKSPRGALYALRTGKGDCTEFTYLTTALCRANNIPCRAVGGYIVTKDTILKPNGYHNWMEFYDDGAWICADPQRHGFKQNQSQYIAMRLIGRSTKNPLGEYPRFRISDKNLRVKMNG